jgi:hypothetical protein
MSRSGKVRVEAILSIVTVGRLHFITITNYSPDSQIISRCSWICFVCERIPYSSSYNDRIGGTVPLSW